MTDLYTALLDAGDRLATALQTGDLSGAASALGERAALLKALREAPHPAPAPPAELSERFQLQDERLNGLLSTSLTRASEAVASAGQAAAAHDRYRAAGRAPSALVDTGRRAAG